MTSSTNDRRVTLPHAARHLRRRALIADDGTRVVLDLPEARVLGDGEIVEATDGTRVTIRAADEDLLEVTGPALPRVAWHIGNRHTPCQIEDARLLIARDAVLRGMLEKLGAVVREVREPFAPEGGAYGHGRTHGHGHAPEAGDDPNAHLHGHSHGSPGAHSHDSPRAHSHDSPRAHSHDHG